MNPAPAGTWTLYFDGACSPVNPGGHGSYGWVLYAPDGRLVEGGKGYLGQSAEMTNNVAEYAAIEAGLTYLAGQGVRGPLLCRGDSQLVVRQVTGRWGFRKQHLRILCGRVLALLERHDSWQVEWVPREQNAEADLLSQEALPEGVAAFRKPPGRVFGKARPREVEGPAEEGPSLT